MKHSTHILFSAASGILLLAGICTSHQVTAQNFNHSNFNAGNNRSAAPAQPTRSNAAPVQQDNRNMNNGGNRQAAPVTTPVQQDNRSMNNGGNRQAAPVTTPVQPNNRNMNNGSGNRPVTPIIREEPKSNYNPAPVQQENRNNNNGDNRYAPPEGRNDPSYENLHREDNRTINGGGRNIGNHDFHQEVRENTEVHRYENYRENDRVNIYHTGTYRGLRPYSYHPYRPFYWGPNWHPFGFYQPYLSANAFRFYMGSQWYYYDNGCYYLPSNGRYTVVAPPIGATVNYLPDGYETPMVGNDTYYYFAGIFYIYNGQNYQVVPAPVGAIVNQLPVGVQEQQINGQDIMVYNNVYYQPISMDGMDAYEVVQSNQ